MSPETKKWECRSKAGNMERAQQSTYRNRLGEVGGGVEEVGERVCVLLCAWPIDAYAVLRKLGFAGEAAEIRLLTTQALKAPDSRQG